MRTPAHQLKPGDRIMTENGVGQITSCKPATWIRIKDEEGNTSKAWDVQWTDGKGVKGHCIAEANDTLEVTQ